MNDRSNEIIKQLNRLANDRSLAPIARNKLRDAVQHIRELQQQLQQEPALEVSLVAQATAEAQPAPQYWNPLESMLPQSRAALRAALDRH